MTASQKLVYDKDMKEIRTALRLEKEAAASQKTAHEKELGEIRQSAKTERPSNQKEITSIQQIIETQKVSHGREIEQLQQRFNSQQTTHEQEMQDIRRMLKCASDLQLAHNEEILALRKKHGIELKAIANANQTILGDLMTRVLQSEQNRTTQATTGRTNEENSHALASTSQTNGRVKYRGGMRNGGAGRGGRAAA